MISSSMLVLRDVGLTLSDNSTTVWPIVLWPSGLVIRLRQMCGPTRNARFPRPRVGRGRRSRGSTTDVDGVCMIDDPTQVSCLKFPFSCPDRPCAGWRVDSPTQYVALLPQTRNYYLRVEAAIGRSIQTEGRHLHGGRAQRPRTRSNHARWPAIRRFLNLALT